MSQTNDAPDQTADPQEAPRPGVSRRNLFRDTGAVGLGAAGLALLPGLLQPAHADTTGATAPAGTTTSSGDALPVGFSPIRPPSVPLAVRSPYLSTWMGADTLASNWPNFWTGRTTAMTGLAIIDGVDYVFLGAPNVPNHPLSRGLIQKTLNITATRSQFIFEGGGVELILTFLSPVEPGNLRLQSIPMSYVLAEVRSVDGASHDVRLYFDISGEWANDDSNAQIGWSQQQVSGYGASVTSLSYALTNQQPLAENRDMAIWGTIVWNATNQSGLSWQIASDSTARSAFLSNGALANTSDGNQPRSIDNSWPVFAFSFSLGTVRDTTRSAVMSVGHVREPAVSYLGTPLPPLWKSYFSNWQDMAAFFHSDATAAQGRTAGLDTKILKEATAAGGYKYAALCALALRQAYAGTELVSRNGQPWAFLKEISSDGNVSTVDVTYPALPVFAYLDPAYLGLLLAPLLEYAENGGWPKAFAEHDLGSHYPVASGHNDGNEEDMPVEESADMLIMTAAYLAKTDAASATAFATRHYTILKQWADYLVANALDPGYQNQTDDFTGFIAHSVNLALKGIVGIGAMAKIAAAAGNTADAGSYQATASSYITQWVSKAQDSGNQHLKLAYDQPGTWSLKYNGYADALLGTGLIPPSVTAQEAAWYVTQVNQYGIPLDLRHSYTKGDWSLSTAAWLRGTPASEYLISAVYDYANATNSRAPFSDWHDTISGRQVGFQARPVVGGVFALLSLGS